MAHHPLMVGAGATKTTRNKSSSTVLRAAIAFLASIIVSVRCSPVILGAAADVALDAPRKALDFAAPDWSMYHKTEELLEQIEKLAQRCEFLEWDSVKLADDSGETRQLSYARFTLSKNEFVVARMLNRKLTILASFGEHGREMISSEVALRFAKILCADLSEQEMQKTNKIRSQLIQELHRTDFVLVPVVSETGRVLAEMGRRCERLNRHNVDVNRNWDFHFGERDHTTLDEEEKPGRIPFSEIESRGVKEIAEKIRPQVYVSFHSGDLAILHPWDHSDEPVAGVEGERLSFVMREIATQHCPKCPSGNAFRLFGYNAYGTGTDYMYGVLKVPYVYTLEIFGDARAHTNDCFRAFNPISAEAFEQTVDNWSSALGTISDAVHHRRELEKLGASEVSTLSNLSEAKPLPAAAGTSSKSSAEVRRREAIVDSAAGIEHPLVPPVAFQLQEAGLGACLIALFCLMVVFVRRRIIKDVPTELPQLRFDFKSA